MRHGVVPRTLHVDEPSPHIDWSAGAVELATEPVEWAQDPTRPRRAAISSFGFSGTNAHVILEEPQSAVPPRQQDAGQPAGQLTYPWVFSAKTPEALREQAHRALLFARGQLQGADGPRIAKDIAYSLATTRAALSHRAAVCGTGTQEVLEGLTALAHGEPSASAVSGLASSDARLAFVFAGQGSQWWGMGRGLYELFPVFADVFDAVCVELDGLLGCSLREVLFEGDGSGLAGTGLTQPALFVVEVALCGLLESWGVVPGVVAGHSVGEFAAAYVAGVVSLEDACRLVVARGRLMEDLPSGGVMVAVEASEADVLPLLAGLEDQVGIAAINSPTSIVLSGVEDAVTTVVEQLGDRRSKALTVSHAFHSPLMDPMLDAFRTVAESVTFHEPKLPIVSTVTGRLITAGEMSNPEYWVQHVRQPVRYADAVQALAEQGVNVFLEVGPGGVLTGLTQSNLDQAIAIPTLRPNTAEDLSLTTALAHLHVHGTSIDWPTFYIGHGAQLVDLPTYPFQRDRYWLEASPTAGDLTVAGVEDAGHPFLGAAVSLADGEGLVLTGRVSLATHPWLAEHTVMGSVLLPGTALVDLALHAAREQSVGCDRMDDFTLESPIVIPEDSAVQLQLRVAAPGADGERALRIHSRALPATSDEPWTSHARGTILPPTSAATSLPVGDLTPWPPHEAKPVATEFLYGQLTDLGLDYGPLFRGVKSAWSQADVLYAEVELPAGADVSGFGVHPALLDASLHVMALGDQLGAVSPPAERSARVPFSWSGVTAHLAHPSTSRSLRVRIAPTGPDSVSLLAADASGRPIVSVESLVLRPISTEQLAVARSGRSRDSIFRLEWTELSLPGGVDTAGSGAARAASRVVTFESARSTSSPEAAGAHARRALELVQEWLEPSSSAREEQGRLVLVTRNAVAVDARDAGGLDVAQATVWGLLRSVQAEHPERFVLVDVGRAPDDGPGVVTDSGHVHDDDTAGMDPEAVLELLAAVPVHEPQIALRGQRAYVPRLTRAVTDARPAHISGDLRLAPAGTVLVTGATGALGRLITRHLVTSHGVRHLVLTSRRGAAATGASALEEELSSLGAEVSTVACDVSDRASLAALIDAIPSDHPLTAVIHAAGVLDDALVGSLTAERLESVFAPKVEAAFHLHQLTRELNLSAFVLFSSLAATFGNAGQANYAAANAYMDALAQLRAAQGLPAVSLAWGPWAGGGAADGSGMAGEADPQALARMARAGVSPLSADEGLALFDMVTAAVVATDNTGAPQSELKTAPEPDLPAVPAEGVYIPVRLNLSALRNRAVNGSLPALLSDLVQLPGGRRIAGAPAPADLAERLAGASDEQRRSTLLSVVRAEVAAVLGHASVEAVGAAQAFRDLGFDSLTAVELRNRLGTATGLRLPASLLFDHPNPHALAEHLGAELPRTSAGGTPEATTPSLLAEIDRLAAALDLSPYDKGTRATVTMRLEVLLAKWQDAGRSTGANGEAATGTAAEADAVLAVQAASDDELFELLDDELGTH
ncbi:SDR family NAD(P)-dependent oxidoreductase [Streptomyces sp. NPDC059076]|uniref:SDR family NAD(P)-dependent oxidoreductase n=2 Tax=Streptomyces TaxID=1883 RepID=UPI00367A48E8